MRGEEGGENGMGYGGGDGVERAVVEKEGRKDHEWWWVIEGRRLFLYCKI